MTGIIGRVNLVVMKICANYFTLTMYRSYQNSYFLQLVRHGPTARAGTFSLIGSLFKYRMGHHVAHITCVSILVV